MRKFLVLALLTGLVAPGSSRARNFPKGSTIMAVRVVAVERPEIGPLSMPERFRHDVAYFMSAPGSPGVPPLGPDEYWIDPASAARWLDEGVLELVSPLDSRNTTEVEISSEQEEFLQWLTQGKISRILLK